MIKGTIELKSGANIEFESNSKSDFFELLKNLGDDVKSSNISFSGDTATAAIQHRDDVHEKRSYTSDRKTIHGQKKGWSDNENHTIAETIVAFPGVSIPKIVDMLPDEIVNYHGEVSSGSQTSRIRRFLAGVKNNGLSKSNIISLRNANFLFGSLDGVKITKRHQRGGTKSTKNSWEPEYIVEIGKIVKNNIVNTPEAITPAVFAYLKRVGELQRRSKATIYTTVSDVRCYLTRGDETKISKVNLAHLTAAGITPVSKTNYLSDEFDMNGHSTVRRIPVVEA